MRTMICECPQDFAGDATVACLPVDRQTEPICTSNSDCTPDMACLNQRCINPCSTNPCAHNADCRVENHLRDCQCPIGYLGNPFVHCFKGKYSYLFCTSCSFMNYFLSETTSLPECTSNTECPSNQACVNQLCQNPCSTNQCGLNAECTTIRHHPTCHCKELFAGDPQIQCFKRKFDSLIICLYLIN